MSPGRRIRTQRSRITKNFDEETVNIETTGTPKIAPLELALVMLSVTSGYTVVLKSNHTR